MTHFIAGMLSVGLMVLEAGIASGQEYPNKPIRMVTTGAGGGNDFVIRLIAPSLSDSLGQPVIVDNRPGALVSPEFVSKAPADGYTLLVNGNSLFMLPLLQKMPFDPVRDFSPITMAEQTPFIVVVHPSLPVKSIKELIALAKSKPGVLNFAANATGSPAHLSGELFKAMAGIDMVSIFYKGSGPSVTDLVGGQVQLMFADAAAVMPHVQAGKLRALAATGLQPSPLFPGLATVAATVPGYESISITGFYAPAKTPEAIIRRLNQELARVLNRADVKERFFKAGVDVVTGSPEEFAAKVKSEIATWGKVIKDRGIKAN